MAVAFTVAIVGAVLLAVFDASAVAVYLVGFAAIASFFAGLLWDERQTRSRTDTPDAKHHGPRCAGALRR